MTPSTFEQPALTVAVGEQLQSDYQVHELPGGVDDASDSSSLPAGLQSCSHPQTEVLANTTLLARIEYLESENTRLKKECLPTTTDFMIEQVKHDNRLVRFYTGFITYHIFLAFFNFLGPVVHKLNYWGSKEGSRVRNCRRKLDPENQLFTTLIKLRLNLKTKDLYHNPPKCHADVDKYFEGLSLSRF